MRALLRGVIAVPALMLLAACSSASGSGSGAGVTAAATIQSGRQTVTLVGRQSNNWDPSTITAAPGALTIKISVPGNTPHDFLIEGAQGSATDLLSHGEIRAITVTLLPGTYRFVCTIHAGMTGKIVVGPSASPS